MSTRGLHSLLMIKSFQHRGLKELFEKGRTRRINPSFHRRILRRLDALDSARKLESLNIPGFDFHKLEGKPVRYTLHVNGPWCVTFEWEDKNAYRVNWEQYH